MRWAGGGGTFAPPPPLPPKTFGKLIQGYIFASPKLSVYPPPPDKFLYAALVVCVCGASVYTVGASYTVQTFVGCLSVTQVAVGTDSTTSILQRPDLFPALFFSTKLDKISYNEHSGCDRLKVMAHFWPVRTEQTWHSLGNTPCMGLYMLAPEGLVCM